MNKKQVLEAVKLSKTMGIYNPKSSLDIMRNFAIIDNSLICRNGSSILVAKSTNIELVEVEDGLYDVNGLKVNKSLEDYPSEIDFDKELVSVELSPEILNTFKSVTELVTFPNPAYNSLICTYFDIAKNCIVATDGKCMIHKSNIDFIIHDCMINNTDKGFLIDIPRIPTTKVSNVNISIGKETSLFRFNSNNIEYSIYTKNNIFDTYPKYGKIMDDYLQDYSLKLTVPNTTFTNPMLDYANKYHDKESVVIFENKTIKSAFSEDLKIEVPCSFGINNKRLQLLAKHISKEAYVENDIKPIVFRNKGYTAIVQPIEVKGN